MAKKVPSERVSARKTVVSKATGKTVDKKRSLAAKRAAITRKANQAVVKASVLKWHHKLFAAGAIIAVIVLTYMGIRAQLDTYAATKSAPGFLNGTGLCMDNANNIAANGNPVRLYKCNASSAQTWSISGGYIKNKNGYCLDTKGTAAASGDTMRINKCVNTAEMKWTYSSHTIVNQHSHLCIGAPSGSSTLRLESCRGTSDQKWTFETITYTIPTMSTKQSLAKSIVDSSKVHWLSGNGSSASTRERVFKDIASGANSGNSLNCGMNIRVLRLIKYLADHHSSVGIGDTNGLCSGVTQGRSAGSRHLGGNGSAVDIYMLDGQNLTGGNSKSLSLLREIKGMLVTGGSLHSQSQVGQANCRSYINLGSVSQITDSCSHVHIDFPPWSDSSLKYKSYAF